MYFSLHDPSEGKVSRFSSSEPAEGNASYLSVPLADSHVHSSVCLIFQREMSRLLPPDLAEGDVSSSV